MNALTPSPYRELNHLTRFPELKKIRASLTEAQKEFRSPPKVGLSQKSLSKADLHQNEDGSLKTIKQEDVEEDGVNHHKTPSRQGGQNRTRNNE